MTGHPDPDLLAEFREGLLGRRRSARIRAHLAACSSCTALSSGLAEVTELLASAPPPPVPDELAARLDAVLAAESAARSRAGAPAAAAQGNGAAGADGRRTGPRAAVLRRPARPPRRWRVAVSVAAAILVLAGGGYGVSRLLAGAGRPSFSSASVSHAARPGAGSAGPGAGNAGARAGPAVRPQVERPGSVVTVIHSGTDYLPARLAAQVTAVLTHHRAGQAPAAGSGQAGRLPGCLNLVTGGTPPTLVDVARYRGRPATVIVRAAAGGRPGQVWVVGPGCSAGTRDLIAHAPLPGSG